MVESGGGYEFWVQDQAGTKIFDANLGDSGNGFDPAEGSRDQSGHSAYGKITGVTTGASSLECTSATVNWTSGYMAALTIQMNEAVNEIIVFYGTEDFDSLSNRFVLDMPGTDVYYSGPFSVTIPDLSPGTTYNFTVWPNTTAENRITGNFTTQSNVLGPKTVQWAFDNSSNANWAANYFHPQDRNITSPSGPLGYWAFWTEGDASGAASMDAQVENFDTDSGTGNIYWQTRIGIYDTDGDGTITEDIHLGPSFWSETGSYKGISVGIVNSSTDHSLHWCYYKWPDWFLYDNITAPQLNRFYNITIEIDNDARWSVQGPNDNFRFQVDGGAWSSWIQVSGWIGDDAAQIGTDVETGLLDARFIADLFLWQNGTFGTVATTFQPPGGGSSNTDPSVNSPADISFSESEEAQTIGWIVTDPEQSTGTYSVTKNGAAWASGTWTNNTALDITCSKDPGTWTYVITASDGQGGTDATDTVIVTVTSSAGTPGESTPETPGSTETTETTGDETSQDPYGPEDPWGVDSGEGTHGSGGLLEEPPEVPENMKFMEILFEALRDDVEGLQKLLNWLMGTIVGLIILMLSFLFLFLVVSEKKNRKTREEIRLQSMAQKQKLMGSSGLIGRTGKLGIRTVQGRMTRAPHFQPPRAPKIQAPRIKAPRLKIPKIKLPRLPKFKI